VTELLIPLAFAAAALSGVTLRFAFTRERRIKRAMKRLRPTAIAEARDGRIVRLVGELVYAGRSITTPLSGRSCAYYTILVEEYRSSGRSGAWHEIVREERGVDFYLRDVSGTALVHFGDGATFPALVHDHRARTSPILHSDADLERFLGERGHSTEGTFFRKNMRAAEGILEAGERVTVAGLARWVPDPEMASGNYRETGKRLVVQATETLAVFLSDDPSVAR
jgi:hypothetical protein